MPDPFPDPNRSEVYTLYRFVQWIQGEMFYWVIGDEMRIPVLNGGETCRWFSGSVPRTQTTRLSPFKYKIGEVPWKEKPRETEKPRENMYIWDLGSLLKCHVITLSHYNKPHQIIHTHYKGFPNNY